MNFFSRININKVGGKSDGGSNIVGKYRRVQTLIKTTQSLVIHIHCALQKLNF